mgnify:CR=1 FL=1
MKIQLSDTPEFDDYSVYIDCITLLDQIRLLEGPRAVDNTLMRHPEIKVFLKNFQRSWMTRVKNNLLDRRGDYKR